MLNLTHCVDVTSVSLATPKLSTLLCAGCKRLPDEQIKTVLQSCPALRTIDLKGCPLITDGTRQAAEQMLRTRQQQQPVVEEEEEVNGGAGPSMVEVGGDGNEGERSASASEQFSPSTGDESSGVPGLSDDGGSAAEPEVLTCVRQQQHSNSERGSPGKKQRTAPVEGQVPQ